MYQSQLILALAIVFPLCCAYSISGHQILDPNGSPILLRGIARPSLEWSATGQYLSHNDYLQMKTWGANVVRLSLSQCFWLSGHAGSNPNYQTLVDTQVATIKSLGMGVILDLHWSDKGDMQGSCDQQNMADANSITFWKELGQRYKNDPWILFELYNEPHDISWDVWLSGGDAGGFTTPGMQALYNAVRSTGANNVIIVSGNSYAYDLTGIPDYALTGSNIVYNTHPYDFPGKQPSDWDNNFVNLIGKYPIMATEFGDYSCNINNYYNKWVAYSDLHGFSWTAWGWFVQDCKFPSLIDDWSYTPSASGFVIRGSLQNTNKVPPANVTITTGSTIVSPSSSSTSSTSYSETSTSTTGGDNAEAQNYYAYTDQDWSWGTRNPTDRTFVHSGKAAYSFLPSNFSAAYFYCDACIDTAIHKGLEFYICGGINGGQKLNFNMVQYFDNGTKSEKIGPDWGVDTYTTNGVIPGNGTWTRAWIDFSEFPDGVYDGFWFIDQSGLTQSFVYLDDITIYDYAGDGGFEVTTGSTTDSSSAMVQPLFALFILAFFAL